MNAMNINHIIKDVFRVVFAILIISITVFVIVMCMSWSVSSVDNANDHYVELNESEDEEYKQGL